MLNFIPLASPDIRIEDINAVNEVLLSGNLVQGKNVSTLEEKMAKYLGTSNCILLTNGTSTLHLILLALGLGQGDEIIIPAFSYIATANVVELVGATPIFVDISLDTFNIDSNQIENSISPRTKAIMIVHEFGLTADIIKIKDICDRNNLLLIEDAACALGAKEENYFAGTLGIAGSFSFHPRKAITSGEGGAVVSNDQNLANKIRALRNHGIDCTKTDRMDFITAGYNCRMTDFQAALLSSQFNRLSEILERKAEIAKLYLSEINNPLIKLPKIPSGKIPSWQTFHVLLQKPLNQKETIGKLRELGIGTNYGAQCMPEQIYFRQKYNHNVKLQFPNALLAYEQGLAIPLYEKLTNEQVSYIIQTINNL
jgi:perosamine synthetase